MSYENKHHVMWPALFTIHNARSQCSFEAYSARAFTTSCVFDVTPRVFVRLIQFEIYPKVILPGVRLRTKWFDNTKAERKKKHASDTAMKFMIFYLICLACSNDLSTRPFCFLSFSWSRALHKPCDALGRWFFLPLYTANSFGELRLGAFILSTLERMPDRRRTKIIWSSVDQLLHGSSISSNCEPVFSNWKIRFLLVATIL